jgi:tRNA-uridine 2-sulfurtransferase
MKKRVLVAMSGGVDSSVAAFLLKHEGYDVTGVTMCLGTVKEEGQAACCGKDAIDDARAVCDKIRIPHHVIDFAGKLEQYVIEKFVSEYNRGRTPNPCIDCNRYLKFGHLLELARTMGFEYLATGHYARIIKNKKDFSLMKARDMEKDQTYFLYPIKKDDLGSILFPIGDYLKKEVREIAEDAGLVVSGKAESQDICFINSAEYESFFKDRGVSVNPGPIVDMSGKEVGIHKGIVFYTVGQRHGLGISSKEPLYVLAINAERNEIVVGPRENLKSSGLFAVDINMLVDRLPSQGHGKIRYRKKEASCRISCDSHRVKVEFDDPQESASPGQSIVFYQGDEVLGGGIINENIKN